MLEIKMMHPIPLAGYGRSTLRESFLMSPERELPFSMLAPKATIFFHSDDSHAFPFTLLLELKTVMREFPYIGSRSLRSAAF